MLIDDIMDLRSTTRPFDPANLERLVKSIERDVSKRL